MIDSAGMTFPHFHLFAISKTFSVSFFFNACMFAAPPFL